MDPGNVVGGRFVIERLAGKGGMGAVYRALDRESDAVVALKVMTAPDPGRFDREAEVLRSLRHPGIVRYVAHGTTPVGERFLAMEWLEGEDLHERLARKGLTVAESVKLAIGVSAALGAAHALGVVHRDVKPRNLFLPGGDIEQVKVLDFGVAHVRALSKMSTSPGQLVGTPAYMAPEQARGAPNIDARADVFSLGCVLFRCVTGSPAFKGEHVVALLAKIILEDAPRLSDVRTDVPQALEALVVRMLSKDRDRRPAHGAALAAELSALGDVGVLPLASPSVRPPGITRGEQRLLSVVLAAAVSDGASAAGTAESAEPSVNSTAPTRAHTLRVEALQAAVAPFDGHVERLLDGSVVATLIGRGAATDQAARASRCAIALRALMPGVPMALATGRGEVAGQFPVGEVIDRAAALVRASSASEAVPGILLDEVTAGLLDLRFEVTGGGAGLALHRERAAVEATRTLLGKPTPCVGRERELALLTGIFEEAVSESAPRVALVTAAAGVGKSRVRYELLRKLTSRDGGVQVWVGRGDPMSAGAPFVMIAPFLRRTAGIQDGEPIESRRKKLAARVARHVDERDRRRVSEFLGEVIGTPFPDDESVPLRTARSEAIVMGDQMKRAWEDFLMAEAGTEPVLIVLEDLHWGDLPSVTYLDAALRVARDRPWMVLAFARPEIHDVFPKLWAGRGVTHVELGDLSPRASEKLVRGVLGSAVPSATVERVVAQAAGNAFYLEELIRAVAEGKGEALPGTVLAMVQARLEALDPETRRLLRAASLFGQVFWRGAVATVLGKRAAELEAGLVELAEKELITELGSPRFPGEAEYCFRHAVVRETAHATLTDGDRVLGHGLAGGWLEKAGEADAVIVAEHFEQGKDVTRAAKWYARAAEQALEGNDLAAALARAEKAAACGVVGEALGALRLLQTEAHKWRGEFAEARTRADEALALLPRGSRGWCLAAGEIANASARVGNQERLVEIGGELRELIRSGQGGDPGVVAAVRTATPLFLLGRYELGESLLSAALATQVAALRAPAVRARVEEARSVQAIVAGDAGSFIDLMEACAASFEEAGDARNVCSARSNLGFGYFEVGEYAEAERCLRDAVAAAERLGLRTVMASGKQNLGMVLARQGAVRAALEAEQEAANEFREHGDRMEAASRNYLALILALAGDSAGAEREARSVVESLATDPPLRAYALAVLAHVLLARASGPAAAEATRYASEAMALLDSLGGLDEGEALVRLVHAECLRNDGDEGAARSAIIVARDRVLARAAKISDPRRRQSFLENVPDNARTLELAKME